MIANALDDRYGFDSKRIRDQVILECVVQRIESLALIAEARAARNRKVEEIVDCAEETPFWRAAAPL